MQIIIPTRGRMDQQITLSSLPRELRKRTTIVCPENEVFRLSFFDVNVEAQPDANWKISQTRAWIMQEWSRRGHPKIIMLDDDLVFFTRKSGNDWHLRDICGKELILEFQRIEDKLGPEFPHAGFGVRQGNHVAGKGWKIPGRMCHSLAYYLPIAAKEARFDVIELREDFAFTLQLLLKGHRNAVWNETVVNQRTNAAGGCSTYRDLEMNNAEAEKLAALFPSYVTLVDKPYKSLPRLEVVCQWRKALRDGSQILHAKNKLVAEVVL